MQQDLLDRFLNSPCPFRLFTHYWPYNDPVQRARAISLQPRLEKYLEKNAIAPSDASAC
jgi:hypothetical protein